MLPYMNVCVVSTNIDELHFPIEYKHSPSGIP
jgi:hypothetical protein